MHSGWSGLPLKGRLLGEPFPLSREWLTQGGQSCQGRQGHGCQSLRIMENKPRLLVQGGTVLPSRSCRL